MNGPDRVPLLYSKTFEPSDIVNIPVVMHFAGPNSDKSEWGFTWENFNNDLALGQPKEPVIKTWSDLKKYKAPDPTDQKRFDGIRDARKKYGPDRYYKASFILTGFSMMTMLRGFEDLLTDMYLNRQEVEELADIVFGFEEQIIIQLKNHGFDAVTFADDYGTQENLIINPNIWREIFKPRLKKEIDLAHEHGLDVFLHSCGYIYDIIPDLIEIGLDVLNPGQPSLNGIKRMGENFGGKICFSCPVNYQTTGISGSKEDIFREIKEYVDNLGCFNGGLIGIIIEDLSALGASQENIKHTIEAFRMYGQYN